MSLFRNTLHANKPIHFVYLSTERKFFYTSLSYTLKWEQVKYARKKIGDEPDILIMQVFIANNDLIGDDEIDPCLQENWLSCQW
mgnify:CR=1 FL=1